MADENSQDDAGLVNHALELSLETSVCPPQEEAAARIDSRLEEVSFTKNISPSEQTSLLKDNPVSVSIFVHEKIKTLYTSVTLADNLHRIVHTSIIANFVLYAITILGSSPQNSIIFSLLFSSVCLTICAIAVVASQSWYKLLFITMLGFGVYIIGASMMAALSSGIVMTNASKQWNVLAVLLICVGEALTRINISEFGMLQFSPSSMEQHGLYVYRIYWIVTLTALVSIAIITAIQQFNDFAVAFYICIGYLVAGMLLFGLQWKKYKRCHVEQTSSLKVIYKIFREARIVKKSALLFKKRSENSVNDDSTTEQPKRFLEYSMIKYGGTYLETDVKEALTILDFAILMACLIPYWVVYAQGYSTYFYQGLHLDTKIGKVHVPVAWIGLSSMLVVTTLAPILDRVVYPSLHDRGIHIPHTWRIIGGMAMAFVSVLLAGCIEVSGASTFKSNETFVQEIGKTKFQSVNISIFCQIPQFVFLGLSEALTSLTALNIANKLCKGTFRRLAKSIYYMAIALGHLLALVFISLGWFPKEVYFSTNSLRNFFFILAGLLAVDVMIFAVVVYRLIDISLPRK